MQIINLISGIHKFKTECSLFFTALSIQRYKTEFTGVYSILSLILLNQFC